MSKYPVPIFQPTIPHDCQSNPLWLEQIHTLMNLQMERQEAFRRQLETQNHLLLQLNRRLDRVFLQLATLETDSVMKTQSFPLSLAAVNRNAADSRDGVDCGKLDLLSGEESETAVNEVPRRPAQGPENKARGGVSSWMQQRESMLKCLVAQLEIEDSFYPAEIEPLVPLQGAGAPESPGLSPQPPSDALPPEVLGEIETLKEQLQAAIREMEVECSVQRAKLSHERARLEAREAELQRREKKLARESREQQVAEERAEPLVSRIKGLLRRS